MDLTLAFEDGLSLGMCAKDLRSIGEVFDPRYDFADAAKIGPEYLQEFKRGYIEGFTSREDDE